MLVPNQVYVNRRKACELLRTTTISQARYGIDITYKPDHMCALEILNQNFGPDYNKLLGLNKYIRANIVIMNDKLGKTFSEIADYIESDDTTNKIHYTSNY